MRNGGCWEMCSPWKKKVGLKADGKSKGHGWEEGRYRQTGKCKTKQHISFVCFHRPVWCYCSGLFFSSRMLICPVVFFISLLISVYFFLPHNVLSWAIDIGHISVEWSCMVQVLSNLVLVNLVLFSAYMSTVWWRLSHLLVVESLQNYGKFWPSICLLMSLCIMEISSCFRSRCLL